MHIGVSGTTAPSFKIGAKGPIIHQGSSYPSDDLGKDGDVFIQHGPVSSMFMKKAGVWKLVSAPLRETVSIGSTLNVASTTSYVAVIGTGNETTTVNLPIAMEGKSVVVKNETANPCTIVVQAIDSTPIDNVPAQEISSAFAAISVTYTGQMWRVVRRYGS